MELFKYCRSEHQVQMLNFGSVRVGTLEDYRRTDKYGELVSDEFEGSKRLDGTIPNVKSVNMKDYPGLKGIAHIAPGSSGKVVITNFRLSVSNLLVFSASEHYSSVTHDRWKSEEGYDSCYQILSPQLFFQAISEALGANYTFLGYGRVHYADQLHIAEPAAGIHPALVKRQSGYSDQSEVRELWRPKAGIEVRPVVIPETSAGSYCRGYCRLA